MVCVCRSCGVLPCGFLLNATQLQPPSREHLLHAPSNGTHPAAKDSLKQHQRKPNGTEIGHDEAFSASSLRVGGWAERFQEGTSVRGAGYVHGTRSRGVVGSDKITTHGLTSSQVHSNPFTVHRLWGGSLSLHRQEPSFPGPPLGSPPNRMRIPQSLVTLLRQTVKVHRL